jgi:hypothetical protein
MKINLALILGFLVEKGISLMKKGGKKLEPNDTENEDSSECELSLLSKVSSVLIN